jgi:lysyl-tRNA synthetase, class I
MIEYRNIKAWPFVEAQKLLDKLGNNTDKTIVFETGYGPSGLPHIGTFGEVARTMMVQNAFKEITNNTIKTKLICFSDDMDALRKVPDNIPNKEKTSLYIGKPLTEVPDPFGEYNSFGEHNNNRLKNFLDKFNFEYEFISSTEYYKKGYFNQVLLDILNNHQKIIDIVKPILGKERSYNYSPFLPICRDTGTVFQVKINEIDIDTKTILYTNPDSNKETETGILDGQVKLQWRADWAMRWKALKINYEMSGKDLIDSVKLSSQICKTIGGQPPEGFNYELFLDENGEKISKSRGNGIAIEDWLKYASQESLSLFMYQSPRKAKRLYFDVIPKNMDEYNSHLKNYIKLEDKTQGAIFENPIWHIHNGNPPKKYSEIQFSLLLNLVSASNSINKEILWGFIKNYYKSDLLLNNDKVIDDMIGYAINYFNDFVKPNKKYRLANSKEINALNQLNECLEDFQNESDPEIIQTEIYRIGKENNFDPLRDWFSSIYEVLLGQKAGPRFGSFVVIYGVKNTQILINNALSGNFINNNEFL